MKIIPHENVKLKPDRKIFLGAKIFAIMVYKRIRVLTRQWSILVNTGQFKNLFL